ncbi:uncharacterized protein [Rutidosis leptorrhynchoides]|uniref:uncharacterized protein n=1 Tax=Rutidosis leptorrhynchoides TaxID=125765 RepID=UPI003A98E6DC
MRIRGYCVKQKLEPNWLKYIERLDKLLAKGKIIVWAYIKEFDVYAIKKDFAVDYIKHAHEFKSLHYFEFMKVARLNMLYRDHVGIPDILARKIRRSFMSKDFVGLDLSFRKIFYRTNKKTGERRKIVRYEAVKYIRKVLVKKMPQNFSPRFRWWYYNERSEEMRIHPSSFCNYNHEINHSKPSQLHYHPPYFFYSEDQQPITCEIFKQPFSNVHKHQNFNPKITNLQSTMNKSSYNNGKFVTTNGGNQFNNNLIHKNDRLTGNKSPRKDRHSKINTARGPRDRRMRLSLDVAKRFFRLQDILGFDKASNTVDWLLIKSKLDIQDLIKQKLNQISCSNASSGSECEVLSGIDDQSVVKTVNDDDDDKVKHSGCNKIKEKKRVDKIRKNVFFHNSLAKETREKARARARKRTTEKRNVKLGYYYNQVMDQNTNWLGSWVPFGENRVQEIDQTDYSSMISTNWNSSFMQSNYHHNIGSSQEHQFISDFQNLAKPWDGINN